MILFVKKEFGILVQLRLIASWSDRLIVIAAGRGSGAMITANCADKYGRKVSFY